MTALPLSRPAAKVQAFGLIRSAPATSLYPLLLAATTSLLSFSGGRFDDRLALALSTNLHQLGRVPVRVLVGSAFWLDGWTSLVLWSALVAIVFVPFERRLGWRRTVLAFTAGHVGATLVVAVGLWIALRIGSIDPSVEYARDVGLSYGFLAVTATATYLLAPLLRVPYAGLLVAYVIFDAATSTTFTTLGHVLAVAIGLACYPLARRPGIGQEAARVRASHP